MIKKPIKIAIVVDSIEVYKWQKTLIELLNNKKNINIILLNLNNANLLIKAQYYWYYFLQSIDALLFRTPIDALQKQRLLLSSFSLKWLKINKVDLIWDFTGKLAVNTLDIKSTKFGFWQLTYSNNNNCLEEGYRALINQQTLINIYLNRYVQDKYYQQKIASVSVESNSINRTNNSYLWRLTYLLAEKLEVFLFNQKDWSLKQNFLPVNYLQAFTSIFIFQFYLFFAFSKLINYYKKYYEQWRLAVICLKTKQVYEFNIPHDRFWADPFIVEAKNETYIFFEELFYKENKGKLKVAKLNKEFKLINEKTILAQTYHLSYPNVFLFEGDYYLLPETADNNTLELYKATEFPYKWQLMHFIMQDVKAYDPTLIEYQGFWYLFFTMKSHADCSSNDSLYIFYADSPLSQHWQAHQRNPVIVNAALARPAGQFFWKDNQLYRPSQNCAGSYGRAININKVCKLSPLEYEEILVEQYQAESDENLMGMHTWNQLGNIAVSDRLYKKVRYGY
jgi:hypothetical protein